MGHRCGCGAAGRGVHHADSQGEVAAVTAVAEATRSVLAIAAQVISTLRSVPAISVARSAGPGAMPERCDDAGLVQRFDGVWIAGYRSANGNSWFSLRLR